VAAKSHGELSTEL